MFFILSKLLLFLLSPFYWVLIIFIWMRLAKSKQLKKRLFILNIILLLVFSNPFIYQTLVRLWQPKMVDLPLQPTYEAGILLGGMAGYDKNGNGYFGDNADRFIQAANLYHQGIIKRIIISGGTGKLTQDEPAESIFLRKELLANGVSDSAIIIETRSRNTFENAVFSKQLIDSMQLRPPFVLVTSALHMRRSVKVFQKLGIPIIAFPCDFKESISKTGIDEFIFPSIDVLKAWSYLNKEVIGLYVYKLTGKA